MFYLEVDSIGPIFDIVEAQIDRNPQPLIRVGRKGNLFTISVNAQDEDVRSDGRRPETAGI